jgi:uncharacterized protein DUF6458
VGIGVGLLLIAAGAILAFAVKKDLQGVDVQVIGAILIVVGVIGMVLDLLLWHSWRPGYRRASYVEGEAPVRYAARGGRRTVVEEEEVAPPPGPPPPPP